ncbi:MAG: hypothetical protein ICV52_09105 [Microcoleus sp. C1-bin4]|nr:hypothetical protein [Microcoleus sp. C1-bin4]
MSQTTLYLWRHDICGHTALGGLTYPQRSPKSPIRPRNPPSIGARYNQKSIGLALRLREC